MRQRGNKRLVLIELVFRNARLALSSKPIQNVGEGNVRLNVCYLVKAIQDVAFQKDGDRISRTSAGTCTCT